MRALVALLFVSIAVQLLGVFHRNVNWDEFLFLSNVYRVVDGHPVGLLQTPYTHLFGWLTRVGGDEIAQIEIARALYLLIWIGSLALLYRLGRRLLDPIGALTGIVLFALFSYSVKDAASFRIDGLLLPVLLAAALLLMQPSTGRVAAAGALSGVALALTIKAVLWAPALLGVLAAGLWTKRPRLKPVIAGGVAAIVTFAIIMLAHAWLLSAGGPAAHPSAPPLARIGSRMLLEDGFLPRTEALVRAVMLNPMTWLLMTVGLVLAVADVRRPVLRHRALLLLVLALPIVSIAFYANAWPYAYLILVPTACLLAGDAFSRYVSGGGPVRTITAAVCLAATALPMGLSVWSLRSDEQAYQEQLLSVVHRLFKQPVAYIDKGGMVSSFPPPPLFMSRWGMKNYRDVGAPLIARYIRKAHPPLLIVNTPTLNVWDETTMRALNPLFRLRAEDAEALRAAYTHYWGAIYLAGRQWRAIPAGESVSFDIVIPGAYTLLANHPANIDGHAYASGATVVMQAGGHRLETSQTESDLRLLWGRGTRIPAQAPSSVPLYTGM